MTSYMALKKENMMSVKSIIKNRAVTFVAGFGACLTVLVMMGAQSPVMPSPVKPATDREVYYPNTEALGSDEMRVIACGTGMPTTRAAQAAACFLVELGNGAQFIFDIGSGSAERISSLQIPYDYLD